MASDAPAITSSTARVTSPWFRAAAAPALLLLIIGCFFWRITLTYQYEWMWEPDLAAQVLPWFEEEARQIHRGEFPLWDPTTWAGQPLLAQVQPGAAYPLNWMLFLFPRAHGHIQPEALVWYFVAIHYLAALFCYLLCRDLGLSRPASMLAGLVFALSSYVGMTRWPQMLNGAIWSPLVFLFLLRAIRGVRPLASASMCGLCLGMAWLSGHHQAPLYITLAAAFAWIFFAIVRRSWTIVKLGAVSGLFWFLVGALQILPMIEYGRLAMRWISAPSPVKWNEAVPYFVHRDFSSPLLSIFGLVITNAHGYTDPFLGVVAVTLGAIAVVTAWRREWVPFFTAIAAGGFFYSLGSHDIFQGFLYAVVPWLDKARTPAAAICICSVGAAVLAAYGFDQLPLLSHTSTGTRAACIVGGIGLLLWIAIIFGIAASTSVSSFIDPYGSTGFYALITAGALYAWRRGAIAFRTITAILFACMLMEVGNLSGSEFGERSNPGQMTDLRKVRDDDDIAAFLEKQPRPFRIDMDTDELALNWPEYHHFDGFKAYLASITLNGADMEVHIPAYRSFWNVTYTIGRKTEMPDAQVVFEGKSGRKVFWNPHAFQRAWSVHLVNAVGEVRDGQALVRDRLNELYGAAFVHGPIPPGWKTPSCPGDKVSVVSHEAETVLVRVNMECDGVVILSDTYYPGWKAYIDGKSADIHEVNLAMRGVAVPAGNHEIRYVYRPKSVFIGGLLTAFGIVAAGFVAFRGRRS